MWGCEGLADFHDLPSALFRAKINRRTYGCGTHVVGFLHGAKENLIGFIWISQQLVMVHLYDEGNFVRILARHSAEHAERGGYSVAFAFHGQLDDILRVEIVGVFREAGPGGMFDTLVDRQNG